MFEFNSLSIEQRARLIEALRSDGIVYALLFGSGAKGHLQFDSDIDIAVAGDCALSSEVRYRLIAKLAAIMNRPIDLIDLKTARGLVFARALQGRELFCDSLRAKGETQYRRVSLVEEDLDFARRSFRMAQPAMHR
jgi:predicted nucleotidyltransferase